MPNRLIESIPPSYFGGAMSKKLETGDKPLLNLAVGIPDQPTPEVVLDAVKSSVDQPENQRYGVFRGKDSFKKAVKDFYLSEYDVYLNEENIAILYGTKSALVQFPMTFIEPGEGVYLPNPGYADYEAGVQLARGEVYDLPLHPENNFLPDYNELKLEEMDNARLIYLNYPSNPLGAVANRNFFDETIERFKDTKTRIVHDFAYAPFSYNGHHPSILQSDPDFKRSMEIYSLSKGFNMSGFRVGFAVGNAEMIESLNKYQDHTQTGMWGVLQDAATEALKHSSEILPEQKRIFLQRKKYITEVMEKLNIPLNPIKGGIFGWLKVPEGFDGESFVDYLLKEQSILATPGIPFGSRGKNYIRISLAVDDAELKALTERLKEINYLWK